MFLLHFVFITTFIILFVVSIKIIRPFRIHKRRPATTIALKTSYLVYLLTFMVFSYLVLFYSRIRPDAEEPSGTSAFYYIIVIFAFVVPNLGIMLRRKFKKLRMQYNVIFTGINLFVILILAIMIYSIQWEF